MKLNLPTAIVLASLLAALVALLYLVRDVIGVREALAACVIAVLSVAAARAPALLAPPLPGESSGGTLPPKG